MLKDKIKAAQNAMTKAAKQARFEPPASALALWNPDIKAAPSKGAAINIYDSIGDDGMGGGVTLQDVSDALDAAGGADITVNINSAGGSFFDGLAMHTLLKEYSGNVTVKVLGLAASAASLVAMGGDDIQIAENGFLMIHNSWTFAMGNKNDMREMAAMLDMFDNSMCEIYSDCTGIDKKKMAKMMDAESWIDGDSAVAQGFCSSLLGSGDVVEEMANIPANADLRKLDLAMAKSGMPRSERRELIKRIVGTPSAVEPATPSAGELTAALEGLLKIVNQAKQKES